MSRKTFTTTRAFIYNRISGKADERTASLETQDAANRVKAAEVGLEVVDSYFERHTAKDFYERVKLQEIRDRIRSGEADSIVVYDLDRLIRDQAHLWIIYDDVKRAGGSIVVTRQEFSDTPLGKLIMSIAAFKGEDERNSIRDRTMRGRMSKVSQGRIHGSGGQKYGYRYIIDESGTHTGLRRIETSEAEVVKRIFTLIANGESAMSVGRKLKEEGVPSRGEALGRRGAAPYWDGAGVKRIIADPTYKGETLLMWTVDQQGRRAKRDTPISLPGTSPAIVDPVLWESANEQMSKRRYALRSTRKYSVGEPMLRGKVFCGICGRLCGTSLKRSERGFYYYYRCPSIGTADRQPSCGNRHVQEKHIDQIAWSKLMVFISGPERILENVNSRKDGRGDQMKSLEESLEDMKSRLEKIDRARSRVVRRLSEADDSEDQEIFDSELARLRLERMSAAKALEEIEERILRERDTELVTRVDLDLVKSMRKFIGKRLSDWDQVAEDRKRAVLSLAPIRVVFDRTTIEVEVAGIRVNSECSDYRTSSKYTTWIRL